MSSENGLPDLPRVRYFPGQRLTAEDLEASQGSDDSLRRLHNRALHGWGIVKGLSIGGKRGDRSVTISSGWALDLEGHELILPESEELTVPPTAGSRTGEATYYALCLTYIDDDSAEATQREGDCQFQGAVRLANSALLAWKESEVLLEGYDILLATIAVRHCMLEEDPSLATRQDIQGCAVPYTAAGIASSDELRWEAWPSAADPAGIEAVVNTEPAGFNAVPAYQAQIASAADPAQVPALAGYAHIVSSQPADFRLRVHLPPVDPFFHELTLKEEHFGGILQLLRTQTDSAIGGKDKKNKVLYSINPDRLSPHDLEVGSTLTVPTKLIRISGKWHVDEVNLTIDLRRVLDHAPEDYRTDDIDEQIAWLIRLNQALGIDLTTSDVSVPDEAFNPGDIVTSISDIITGGILNPGDALTNIVDIFTGGNLLVDRQLYLAVPKEMTVGAQELELVVQAATDEWLDSIGNPYDFEDPYRQLILTKNGFTGGNWGLTVNQALLVPDGPALNEARMMREQALARLDWSVHWMGVEL